jgi:hypothetical protein
MLALTNSGIEACRQDCTGKPAVEEPEIGPSNVPVAKKIESTGKADFSVVYATRMEFLRTTGGRRAV